MGTYNFQQTTADRIAEIFRKATVGENNEEKLTGGQRRVLLADEVGLGKTIVAREVISRVREMRKQVGDEMFRVVYVCSNMQIVRQNIANLGVKENLDVSESRLSMQHLIIAKKDMELKRSTPGNMPEMLIPLTPATSFSQNASGIGNIPERALMAVVLSRMEALKDFPTELKDFFRSKGVRKTSAGWQWFLEKYNKEVDKMGPEYIEKISSMLQQYPQYQVIKSRLQEIFKNHVEWNPDHNRIINSLRRIFADISLSMLEPDLIIMDEFQRFSSLLDYNDDNEQSAIVKKFFEQEDGQEPMILLLSATPYKPFTTLEELTENNADEHYEDFTRLMDFLFKEGNNFRELWSDYSNRLLHLKTEKFDVVVASKKAAEDKMYEGMCRTERLNEGLISTRTVKEIPISEYDVISFYEMQRIIEACREITKVDGPSRFHWQNMPIDYVKSSPYLLSFMDSYELKKQISTMYKFHKDKLPKPGKMTLLRERDIACFRDIPLANARLNYLKRIMIPEKSNAEQLLWVPASIPYYNTDDAHNPFEKNKDFSKALVFSAWEMVPRMLSVLLTYSAEREVIVKKGRKASYVNKKGSDRIKEKGGGKNILTFPSKYLADLFSPRDSEEKNLKKIKREIGDRLEEKLQGIVVSDRIALGVMYDVLKWLDGEIGEKPEAIPPNTVEFLTDMAIGAPGVCLYRILHNKTLAIEASEGFVTLFNRRVAGYIIDRIKEKNHDKETYLSGVMNYCVMGNLQAVLDEYRHLCVDDLDFVERMKTCFIREVPLQVDTYESFLGDGNPPKKSMRTYYAVPFSKGNTTMDQKGEQRSNNIRVAFQSPFYPFVVVSTSVGQEGLDFHWYCRRIVHWNLPSNPQDLEQREGRINRYKCLAIRRNIAHRFPEITKWYDLFEKAANEVKDKFGDKYSEMVPNWCLPTEWLNKDNSASDSEDEIGMEWIERIVPEYPMSSDVEHYQRLIDVLSLYRLTMGQPRQEELLEMLESRNLTRAQISTLLFNLSPIRRKNTAELKVFAERLEDEIEEEGVFQQAEEEKPEEMP